MQKHNKNKKRKLRNIVTNNSILDQIANSNYLSESEKITFLKYIWYLVREEQEQLSKLI